MDILLYLGLVGEVARTRESKGSGWITLYTYTEFGMLITLLVMTLFPEKKDKAIRYIYELFCKIFENNPSSVDTFSLLFVNKLYKNNLFANLVNTFMETIQNKITVTNADELFNNSLAATMSEQEANKFMHLRRDAFDELNPDMERYFMHRQKLGIERKMFQVSKNLKGFEKLEFELRNDYENIAAEGHCQKCEYYFPVKLSLLDYLNRAYSVDDLSATCPDCKEENSMLIPLFLV